MTILSFKTWCFWSNGFGIFCMRKMLFSNIVGKYYLSETNCLWPTPTLRDPINLLGALFALLSKLFLLVFKDPVATVFLHCFYDCFSYLSILTSWLWKSGTVHKMLGTWVFDRILMIWRCLFFSDCSIEAILRTARLIKFST